MVSGGGAAFVLLVLVALAAYYVRRQYWRKVLRRYGARKKSGVVEAWDKNVTVMQSNPFHGRSPRHVMKLAVASAGQRENPLTPELKKRIAHMKRRVGAGGQFGALKIGQGPDNTDGKAEVLPRNFLGLDMFQRAEFGVSAAGGGATTKPRGFLGRQQSSAKMFVPLATGNAAEGGFDPNSPDGKFTFSNKMSKQGPNAGAAPPAGEELSPINTKSTAKPAKNAGGWFGFGKKAAVETGPAAAPDVPFLNSNPMAKARGAGAGGAGAAPAAAAADKLTSAAIAGMGSPMKVAGGAAGSQLLGVMAHYGKPGKALAAKNVRGKKPARDPLSSKLPWGKLNAVPNNVIEKPTHKPAPNEQGSNPLLAVARFSSFAPSSTFRAAAKMVGMTAMQAKQSARSPLSSAGLPSQFSSSSPLPGSVPPAASATPKQQSPLASLSSASPRKMDRSKLTKSNAQKHVAAAVVTPRTPANPLLSPRQGGGIRTPVIGVKLSSARLKRLPDSVSPTPKPRLASPRTREHPLFKPRPSGGAGGPTSSL